jgi:dTDP-4-amino-4,6-dideoxygalactose transaminase
MSRAQAGPRREDSGGKELKVPLIDLTRQYHSLKNDIDGAIAEVVESGRFIMGPWVGGIEKEISGLMGTAYGIGVASGTDALEVALRAVDLQPGEEVITTPFSFVSVAEVAVKMGAGCVFVDIDAANFNIIPDEIEAAITPKTKAIVPVHLFGQSADMDSINEIAAKKGIPVIEDACQAVGSGYKNRPVGSLGEMATLSFFPTKNLGCYGDGGMVLTSDEGLYERASSIRKHGESERYKYKYIGMNSRLDSIQAAVLLVKARRIKQWNERRREIAAMYDEAFADLPVVTPHVEKYAYHIYHQYTIKVEKRDEFRTFLNERGVGNAIHYPLGIHLQEAYEALGYKPGDLPNTEEAARTVVSLPVFPELEQKEIEYVIASVREFFQNGR